MSARDALRSQACWLEPVEAAPWTVTEHARDRWAERVRPDYGGPLLGALMTAVRAEGELLEVCREQHDRYGVHADCEYFVNVDAGVVFAVIGERTVNTVLPGTHAVLDAAGASPRAHREVAAQWRARTAARAP